MSLSVSPNSHVEAPTISVALLGARKSLSLSEVMVVSWWNYCPYKSKHQTALLSTSHLLCMNWIVPEGYILRQTMRNREYISFNAVIRANVKQRTTGAHVPPIWMYLHVLTCQSTPSSSAGRCFTPGFSPQKSDHCFTCNSNSVTNYSWEISTCQALGDTILYTNSVVSYTIRIVLFILNIVFILTSSRWTQNLVRD